MSEERRLVTILFSDVTGSTALGESLDPEDLRALLRRYYEIAREVVAASGGTLEKFIGDAVMAVFGLPQAHGDDAERALAAAMDLRNRVRDDPALGERLPIRLGVASGEVVAAREAASGDDFLITGDAVNTAARLQQAAEPWSILVAERTARAARGFRFGPRTAIAAKGKGSAIPAAPLLALSEQVEPRLPMVGRDADLAQLELVAQRAFSERRPFLVNIVAPAGTGKTRLLEALLDRLAGLEADVTVTIAQCLPYGQRLTFWPMRTVLFRLIGADPDTPADALHGRTVDWLRDREVPDADIVASQLLATLGAAELETTDRAALFGAWRTALQAAAAEGPLVLVFEDLHWSSDSLLDLVEALLQPRGDLPILLVVLARPELLDRRPTWSGGRRNAVSLALEPLPDVDVATLVRHLVEGAPTAVVETVVARADGNPFYAGEIVRAIVERVGPELDPAAVDAALATLPDTVQATVLARLDLLDPDERRTLQIGSVFGREFRPAGVAALEPSLQSALDDATGRLLDRDLVRPSGSDGLTFRHILIREVAYGTLPRAERARLHATAARWLEARAVGQEEAYAELIAVHAREAAILATALGLEDAETLRRDAVTRLVAAAASAQAAAANLEALRHLRAALELAPPDAHLELYERIGATSVHGQISVEALEAALRLARESNAPPERILRIIAGILTFQTRWQGSVPNRPTEAQLMKTVADGRALLDRVADEQTRARFLVAEAFLPFWVWGSGRQPTDSEVRRADICARDVLEIAARLDDPGLQSAALDALGGNASQAGRWDEVAAHARRRLEFGTRLELAERIDAACMVAWAGTIRGELAEADTVSATAQRLIQPGQGANWALHLAAWRTLATSLLGRWEEALAAAERAYRWWQELERLSAGYAVRGFAAALDVARARRDDVGATRWREVIESIQGAFPRTPRSSIVMAHAAGDFAGALHALQETPDPGQYPVEQLERLLSHATDRALSVDEAALGAIVGYGGLQQARPLLAQADRAIGFARRDPDRLRDALASFEAMEMVPSVARARCELGLLIGDEGLYGAGVKDLQKLGDVDQQDRYEAMAG